MEDLRDKTEQERLLAFLSLVLKNKFNLLVEMAEVISLSYSWQPRREIMFDVKLSLMDIYL